jgi:iron complex outermembrane receptor protein
MTHSPACRRLAALPLALAAAYCAPSLAQSAALPETTVSATRFPEQPRSLPYGVSVVTAEEIARSGASSVNEALMRVLGIPGRQDFYGGGDYSLDLRGFGTTSDTNQVIVVDGVRISENDLGGTRLAGIPIDSVDRIEVLRGSGAVLYGEGATGGVIVITTKAGAGKQQPNSGSVYAGVGSYGLRDLRANAHLGGGGFSVDLSGQKRKADNHRDNFASDLDAASIGAQWSGERVRVGARLTRDDLDAGLPGALTDAQFAANPRQSPNPLDRASLRNELASAFAEVQAGGWQFGWDVGQRRKQLRSFNFGTTFDYDIQASTSALRARHQATFGGIANELRLGIDLGHWTRDRLGAFASTGTQSSLGVYARDDVTLAGGTRLSAGARTERVRKNLNDGFAPSGLADRVNAWEVGASQPVAADTTVFARLGRSFRLANVDEFSFTTPGVPLRPQTSRDIEIGARWVPAGARVEARLYRHQLTDEIGFDPNGVGTFGPFGANVNLSPTRRQGIEVEAMRELTRAVAVRVNAAVRQSTFLSGPYAGNDVPLSPRRTLAVRGDWSPVAGQRLTGGVQWVGTQTPQFDNACRMPAYTTVDARYAVDWRNAEFSLGVSNLLDKRYYTQAFGCTPAGQVTSIYPEAGRAVTAAVRVNFK